MSAPRWLPLESNPDVMNKFLSAVGVSDIPAQYKCHDVYGLDDEMLAVVPKPVLALLFLFPASDNYKKYSESAVQSAKSSGAAVSDAAVYFTEQTVHNACGTVALIHAIANNTDTFKLESGKPLQKFLEATAGMSSSERAKYLEGDASICDAHAVSAKEGQTTAPDISEEVSSHFVTLVSKSGSLYELDGRKPIPINHGPTTADTFLKDAAKVCKAYMSNDPNEVNFTVVALAKA